MTLYNVGDVVFLNVTSGILPDPDWQLGVVTRATNSYGWTAATTFPDQNVIKVDRGLAGNKTNSKRHKKWPLKN